MSRLDQKTFQAIALNAGPYPELLGQSWELTFPSDRLIVTVTSSTSDRDWVRAGYCHYVWPRSGDETLVSSFMCYLATSKVCVIEPLETAIIAFEPVPWLKNWIISIEASIL